MNLLRDLSIRRKLTALVVVTTGVALTFSALAFVLYDSVMVRSALIKERTLIADIVGSNSTAALTFVDHAAAEETLAALRAEPAVTAATVYDAEGLPFASYARDPTRAYDPPAPAPGQSVYTADRLQVFRAVSFDGRHIGTVYIESDLVDLRSRVRRYAAMVVLIIIVGSMMALLLLSKAQGIISTPILDVVRTARIVSEGRDYSVRTRKYGGDEIGTLADTFNEMLDQVQERDRQLRTARDAAEAANLAKSSFLANMSHELRTPLNGIIGYSEMLCEEAPDRGHHELVPDLERIREAAGGLLALIDNILDLTKIEAGRMQIFVEDFDIAHMVQSVVTGIHPLARARSNRIEISVPVELEGATMRSDLTKVQQSLRNLLSNACKFTDKGTIRLLVRREIRENGPWFLFSVADTGIGITPEQLSRLFGEFVQADSSTNRRYGGSGLGLAISRRFCRQLGGEITTSSVEGQGSVFTIHLPALCAADSQHANV